MPPIPLLHVHHLSIQRASVKILDELSFDLFPDEHLAIVGPAGSGKTTLGKALALTIPVMGTIRYDDNITFADIAFIPQQHHFKNLSNLGDFYYQQRYNSIDAEDTLTVETYLESIHPDFKTLIDTFGLQYLLPKHLIQLSNGENKKVQIITALLKKHRVLILDQAFTGLDTNSRELVKSFLEKLINQGYLLVLITTPREIPDFITHVLALEAGHRSSYQSRTAYHQKVTSNSIERSVWSGLLNDSITYSYKTIVRLKDVTIQYGDKIVLHAVNWTIQQGDRWMLSGPNGSGKTTLLSLIVADNPQAYAQDIVLFDRPRGSGESIWDIKKKIGYVSAELIQYFDTAFTVFAAIASGLYDTIGLFKTPNAQDTALVRSWIHASGLTHLSGKKLYELSLGLQRKVLFIRALIKNPPILILDEVCQGLDDVAASEILDLIDLYAENPEKTVVFVSHYIDQRPRCIKQFYELR